MPNKRRSHRNARIRLDQQANLVTSDGHVLAVILKDLSRNGFKVEHGGADLLIGEIVRIRSGRWREAKAEIRWTNEKEAGGVFLDDPDIISK